MSKSDSLKRDLLIWGKQKLNLTSSDQRSCFSSWFWFYFRFVCMVSIEEDFFWLRKLYQWIIPYIYMFRYIHTYIFVSMTIHVLIRWYTGSNTEAVKFLQRHSDDGEQIIVRMRGLPYSCTTEQVVCQLLSFSFI